MDLRANIKNIIKESVLLGPALFLLSLIFLFSCAENPIPEDKRADPNLETYDKKVLEEEISALLKIKVEMDGPKQASIKINHNKGTTWILTTRPTFDLEEAKALITKKHALNANLITKYGTPFNLIITEEITLRYDSLDAFFVSDEVTQVLGDGMRPNMGLEAKEQLLSEFRIFCKIENLKNENEEFEKLLLGLVPEG